MKAISRWLDRFCYKHPNFGIPNLMKYIAIGNVIVFVGDMLTRGMFSLWIDFYPDLILQGQVWRLFTFIFSPMYSGFGAGFLQILFFAISTYFYYSVGTALERRWGATRFTVFYGLGVLVNILLGLATYAVYPIQGMYVATARMYYVNLSLFFSFATLYPDVRVLLYGIIPLKVKWIAWLDVALFAYDMLNALLAQNWFAAAMPVLALLNYLIFFYEDLADMFNHGKARVKHRTNPQVVQFKKAQQEVKQRKGYLHKCAVCGVTDADNPDMEFRYCSRCNGYYCYCMDHINNHTHVQ